MFKKAASSDVAFFLSLGKELWSDMARGISLRNDQMDMTGKWRTHVNQVTVGSYLAQRMEEVGLWLLRYSGRFQFAPFG